MSTPVAPLSPSSYLVLGLVARVGEATPYDLKRLVAESVGFFWSFPHAQLYSEPNRLVGLGLLAEHREEGGRRRRRFRLTPAGRGALDAWLDDPATPHAEIRDLGLLKVFLSDPLGPERAVRLAEVQLAALADRLGTFEARLAVLGPDHEPRRRVLRMGIRIERAAIAFWEEIRAEGQAGGNSAAR